MKKMFCVYCEGETEYFVKEVLKEYSVKGIKVKGLVKEAHCNKCGQKLFVYEIEKENQKTVFDAYKKKVGLLTSEEIIAIRKKYNLSQRKLARLIHCGEKNIARYENCAIQDKTINLLIVMLDEHPEYFGLHTKPNISKGNWIVLSSCYCEEIQKNTITTKLNGNVPNLRGAGCNA